ncbi:MAG TPA: hypothetical protein VFC71_07435 [Candidatus Polarisedimenticolia bacterium]|nr:hypothetical protein [Candidatus Polarisedimenticolia bacterium]
MNGRLRQLAPRWIALGWAAFALGTAVMLVATLVYGDWYVIRRPWTDIGLGLIAWGLGLAAVSSVIVAFRPIGWPTLFALPGIALTGFFWIAALFMPLSGGCCTGPSYPLDPGTILYSLPVLIPVLAAATALIAAPSLVAIWLRR